MATPLFVPLLTPLAPNQAYSCSPWRSSYLSEWYRSASGTDVDALPAANLDRPAPMMSVVSLSLSPHTDFYLLDFLGTFFWLGWLTVSMAKKCLFVADSQGLKQRWRKYLHRKDWPREFLFCGWNRQCSFGCLAFACSWRSCCTGGDYNHSARGSCLHWQWLTAIMPGWAKLVFWQSLSFALTFKANFAIPTAERTKQRAQHDLIHVTTIATIRATKCGFGCRAMACTPLQSSYWKTFLHCIPHGRCVPYLALNYSTYNRGFHLIQWAVYSSHVVLCFL